ncbi:MAG: GNAT family protein [Ferruginibacter sp.]
MVRLEQFGSSDFKQLIEWITDEELLTNWSGNLFSFPLTTKSLEWYLQDTNILDKSDAFIYKVVDLNNQTIGHISLGSISWKNRSARLTRVLLGSKSERGKGCCHEMVTAALKIAFEELNLHRVSLGVYDNNLAAKKCYEKSGFIIEGIHRDVLWYKEKWWSMIEMSILQKEWKGL